MDAQCSKWEQQEYNNNNNNNNIIIIIIIETGIWRAGRFIPAKGGRS
jgi:hypothetical protein